MGTSRTLRIDGITDPASKEIITDVFFFELLNSKKLMKSTGQINLIVMNRPETAQPKKYINFPKVYPT